MIRRCQRPREGTGDTCGLRIMRAVRQLTCLHSTSIVHVVQKEVRVADGLAQNRMWLGQCDAGTVLERVSGL